jgi:hypothetical protein
MVRTFLKVYMELCSYFLFLQEQIKDIIIIYLTSPQVQLQFPARSLSARYCFLGKSKKVLCYQSVSLALRHDVTRLPPQKKIRANPCTATHTK